jgi:hypothetical protein
MSVVAPVRDVRELVRRTIVTAARDVPPADAVLDLQVVLL